MQKDILVASLLTIGVSAAGIYGGLRVQAEAGSEFTQEINDSIAKGRDVEIVEGTYRIGRYVSRRQWDQVLYVETDLHSNVSYSGVEEDVDHPLYRTFDKDKGSNRFHEGDGWLVYHKPGSERAVAVLIERNNESQITPLDNSITMSEALVKYRKRVLIEDSYRLVVGQFSRPVSFYRDGNVQRSIAVASLVR